MSPRKCHIVLVVHRHQAGLVHGNRLAAEVWPQLVKDGSLGPKPDEKPS